MAVSLSPEEKTKLKKEKSKIAIELALESKWEEAAIANRTILEVFPDDVEALNRLGKALMETGASEEARKTLTRALELSPYNAIARKNLDRLQSLGGSKPVQKGEKLAGYLLIEETGRTGVTSLIGLAPQKIIAKMSSGDPVRLKPEGPRLKVVSAQEEYLGQVEPRLALRLIKLMEGGNRYAAAVTGVGPRALKVIIKETFQHPSQAGKVSIPLRGGETPRAYIRGGLLKYASEEDAEINREMMTEWEEEEGETVGASAEKETGDEGAETEEEERKEEERKQEAEDEEDEDSR